MLKHSNRNTENYQILKNIVSNGDINQMYQTAIKTNLELKLMKTYIIKYVRQR